MLIILGKFMAQLCIASVTYCGSNRSRSPSIVNVVFTLINVVLAYLTNQEAIHRSLRAIRPGVKPIDETTLKVKNSRIKQKAAVALFTQTALGLGFERVIHGGPKSPQGRHRTQDKTTSRKEAGRSLHQAWGPTCNDARLQKSTLWPCRPYHHLRLQL